ncbi:hypothetical protein CH363_12450 [Leptospira haakeii]|uniref:Uncharacterized protein n=1 Tax=Leptospira haakeii TaxID=2023198 RepID=A0ABX4PJ54_9LEPT|nr:hypothetical protein CH363_12450 [Leptospira haakeii]PKA18680.1 hypothetical protein CH377_16045 [Leptospira haakeii]
MRLEPWMAKSVRKTPWSQLCQEGKVRNGESEISRPQIFPHNHTKHSQTTTATAIVAEIRQCTTGGALLIEA